MELEQILTIVSAILGIIVLVAGSYYAIVKGKLNQFKAVVKEGKDVVDASIGALDDDKITSAEVEKIKQEAAEFKAAVKLLFAKTE